MISVNRQEAIRTFVEKEVFACQSSLIDELLNKGIFSFDDIINLYRRFDGKLIAPNNCYRCNLGATYLDSETGECEQCFEDNQQPQDIYEWWVVSNWLELKLKLAGEPILSNEYGSWWGRCCTGQAIYMDAIIEEIYDEIMEYSK